MGAGESQFVAADAQFGIARVIKPFPTFETVYQGQSALIPVAFPGGRDPQAGAEGFDPNLMLGFPVPYGARLSVWIPVPIGDQQYQFTFAWRMRNVRDFRANADQRPPFHFPKQIPGSNDNTAVRPLRFVLPAAADSIIYEQAEPAGIAAGVQHVTTQTYQVITPSGVYVLPFLDDSQLGIYQQGIADPAATGPNQAYPPAFHHLWMDCHGDELIIIANRSDPDLGPWDFSPPSGGPGTEGLDYWFGNIYGTGGGTHKAFDDVGIYILTGTNP